MMWQNNEKKLSDVLITQVGEFGNHSYVLRVFAAVGSSWLKSFVLQDRRVKKSKRLVIVGLFGI